MYTFLILKAIIGSTSYVALKLKIWVYCLPLISRHSHKSASVQMTRLCIGKVGLGPIFFMCPAIGSSTYVYTSSLERGSEAFQYIMMSIAILKCYSYS